MRHRRCTTDPMTEAKYRIAVAFVMLWYVATIAAAAYFVTRTMS